MPLIEDTLLGHTNKVDIAIQRIKNFDPLANGFMGKPYYVAYSGGKDSDALRILFELSGVKYDLAHNHTTVDAPETIYYVRSIPNIQIDYPKKSMWRLIVESQMPPTRLYRYCCSKLKEQGGKDRFTSTGVRWAESNKRKANRSSVEIIHRNRQKSLILNADNDDSRMMIEHCQMKGKRILNPIIDWSDSEVWELLNYYNCPSNPLYQCGYTRIGCIGCPLAGSQKMIESFERYPTYKANYIRAFGRMLVAMNGTARKWKTGQDVFDWWVSDKAQTYVNPDQLAFNEL